MPIITRLPRPDPPTADVLAIRDETGLSQTELAALLVDGSLDDLRRHQAFDAALRRIRSWEQGRATPGWTERQRLLEIANQYRKG